MNFRMILKSLGMVLLIEAACMLPSIVISLIYRQNDFKAFLVTMVILLAVSFILHRIKPATTDIYARDGFAIVSLSWILVSVFGALPFVFSGAIPSYIDAFFETVSGFTTTGASILREVERLPEGILFWRSFTQWVGGMGVMVLILAVLPAVKTGSLHIMHAESPGPNPEKLVPKIGDSAKFLYAIYIAMTAALVILLLLAGMPFFDSLCHAFSTTGTGGFSIKNTSVGAYNNIAVEVIIAIFMFLSGINYSLYYQAIRGNLKSFFRNSEFRFYLGIILASILYITLDLTGRVYGSILESLRHASFHVSSIITTTGYSAADFNLWTSFSKSILVLLMFTGACAGSTSGGIKSIRIVILLKTIRRDIAKIIHPRSVYTIKVDGKIVDDDILSGVMTFFFAFIAIFALSVLAVSLDGNGMISNFTAVASCIGNIGPGLGIVGPMSNFSGYSILSKLVLSFCMLAGRLEIFPILLLFAPTFWKRVNI